MTRTISRRDALAAAGLAACSLAARDLPAQPAMPTRPIPATGEPLPVLGLGSSAPVQQISSLGEDRVAAILRTLLDHGGRLIDTWPRNAENDAAFGAVLDRDEFRDALFVTTKIDQVGEANGVRQFDDALRNYRKTQIDLAQIFSLTDVDTHWPNLQKYKAEGRARYIGVTVSEDSRHAALEDFVRRNSPDFVQVNYSITERAAEDRLLPLLADEGIAVIINRPFMNGSYFDRLAEVPLPDWTAEFDCTSWAQFSLKYILANPNFTAVLTETSNPVHMAENALTATGTLPDEATRARMRDYIDGIEA